MRSGKAIAVHLYDDSWPSMFEHEKSRIIQRLGNVMGLEIHHIGSTAVPGLAAKPVIDILIACKNPREMRWPMEHLGYQYRGGMNIPGRLFFDKKRSATSLLDIHCHVHEKGSPEVTLNLLFRDYLRRSVEDRKGYQNLKIELAQDPYAGLKERNGLTRYTLGKDTVIREILNKTSFDGLCSRFCTHHNEWLIYHRIRSALGFRRDGGIYSTADPIFSHPRHYHVVLYKGTQIVAGAHVEELEDDRGAMVLRFIASEPSLKRPGIEAAFVSHLNKWVVNRTGRPLEDEKGGPLGS